MISRVLMPAVIANGLPDKVPACNDARQIMRTMHLICGPSKSAHFPAVDSQRVEFLSSGLVNKAEHNR